MDHDTARKEIVEANARLGELDEKRQALVAWIAGLEGWLKLHPDKGDQLRLPMAASTRSSVPKGEVSFRSAILSALQGAHGEPLHVNEILARARAAGADTESKTPDRMVELVLYNLKRRDKKPVEKVAPRTWRWMQSAK